MQTEILYRPAFSMTQVQLQAGEEIRVESGSMVSMSAGVTIETKMQGGLLKSLARSVLGGVVLCQYLQSASRRRRN
jgi:uncharacterized protein (AIM24 family)